MSAQSEKRLALSRVVLQFSSDLEEVGTRIDWALPAATRFLSEQEIASLSAAEATITQLRHDLQELADRLAVEVVPG